VEVSLMRYEVTVQPDVLNVEVAENHSESPGEARELLYAVTEAVFKHGRKPILICAPEFGPLSLPELYILARHVIDTPLRHCRIAFIYKADHELTRFMDDLGAARGLTLAVFDTVADARQWLTGRTSGNLVARGR
jgi:hypothetical protein